MASNMFTKKRIWIPLLLVIYLVGLITYAPASAIGSIVSANLPPQIKLQGWHGSVWNGRIDYIESPLPSNSVPLQLYSLSWELQPSSLLTLSPTLSLQAPAAQNMISGEALVTLNLLSQAMYIESANFGGNIAQTISQYKVPSPFNVDGNWSAEVRDLPLEQCLPAQAQAQAQAAAAEPSNTNVALTTRGTAIRINQQWIDLQSFNADVACQNGNLSVTLNPNNTVGLALQAEIGQRNISLNGSLTPNAQTPAQIRELLVYLGKPDAQGSYNFQLTL